jgi:hypothetical protein
MFASSALAADDTAKKNKQGWFLIVPVYNCGECKERQMRIIMPSVEVCREVRDLNSGMVCVMQDDTKASKRRDDD